MASLPSSKYIDFDYFESHYIDIEAALRGYFDFTNCKSIERFFALTKEEVKNQLDVRLKEHDMATSLSVLAAVEALFRNDYLRRYKERRRDVVSKKLRLIYKEKKEKANLESDILETWALEKPKFKPYISEFKAALKYRHWLAHGRYWQPKLGRNYNFYDLLSMSKSILYHINLSA